MWGRKKEVMTNEREANDEERVAKKGECSDGKRGMCRRKDELIG